MAAIVSPQPRPARSSRRPSSPHPPLSPPLYVQEKSARLKAQKRARFSPPRLMSPIDLFDPRSDAPHTPRPSTPCSRTKRRRGLTLNPVRSPRRRHCPRADCPVSPLGGPGLFDRLPWISQLESSPERLSAFDTADLSMLVEEFPRAQSPRIGPVRRRRTSMRSSPITPTPAESAFEYFPPSLHELPVYSLLPPDRFPSSPRTPPPRDPFLPSEVHFQGLRPLFPPGLDDVPQTPNIDSP